MEEIYTKRIDYKGELGDISKAICKTYTLGELISNKLILMGFEDFNFNLETTKGKYFVKIFGNYRKDEDCERYVDIMLAAEKAGVSTPKLYRSNQGYLNKLSVEGCPLRLCVMEHIEGQTIFELNEKLNLDEIKFIAKQAALINSMEFKPKYLYDSWAIVNFLKEFEKKSKYLPEEDMKRVQPLIEEFKEIKVDELPHCFVHGDILKTNVMKDVNNKLWIIDFSVSNYYPRIQELAVLACNLFFNAENKEESEKNLDIALKEYQRTVKLTDRELKVLPTYIKLAHAMHIVGSHQSAVEGSSEETEYWLKQGRSGLEQMV